MEYVTGDPNQGGDSESSYAETDQNISAPQAPESQTIYSLADAADFVGQVRGVSVFQPAPAGESISIEAPSPLDHRPGR